MPKRGLTMRCNERRRGVVVAINASRGAAVAELGSFGEIPFPALDAWQPHLLAFRARAEMGLRIVHVVCLQGALLH